MELSVPSQVQAFSRFSCKISTDTRKDVIEYKVSGTNLKVIDIPGYTHILGLYKIIFNG
jgi:hypothetical protein